MVDKTDRAISKNSASGIGYEPTYSGVTSLFRREYSKIVKQADLVTWGVTYDLSVTNRPGARFGPRAIREASTNLAWDCLLYTSPSPRDATLSRMPSSA